MKLILYIHTYILGAYNNYYTSMYILYIPCNIYLCYSRCIIFHAANIMLCALYIILYICEQIILLYWLTIFKGDLCFASTLVGEYSVGVMYIQYVLQSILTPLPSKLPLTYTTYAYTNDEEV